MADLAALAQQARSALMQGRDATLLVQGIAEPAHRTSVVLHEDGGRPRLVCQASSPIRVIAHAGRPAILSVTLGADGAALFAGALAIEAIETVDGVPHYVVGMRLKSVFVELHTAGPMRQFEVPLDVYFAGLPDQLDRDAARLREHANARHATELRRLVADWAGLPEGEIIAARLGAIDRAGAAVDWIDRHGSHSRRLEFGHRAESTTELSSALQAQLRS